MSSFSAKICSPKSYEFRFGFIFVLALVFALFTQQSFAQAAQTAEITWAQDSSAAGYIVYCGSSSRNYTSSVNVSNTTSCTLQNLSSQTYYIAITAYDSNNNQTAYSPELVLDSLTASAGSGGSISPSGSFFQAQGASQTFTIIPSSGDHVAGVLVNGGSVGAVTSYTMSAISGCNTISATFSATPTTPYTISASAGSGGSISPSGSVSVNSGASQTITIAANSGYQISAVTVDGSSVGAVSSYTFSGVTANHSISATFATSTPSSYIITASANSGGSISPSGTVSVSSGGSQAFTIAANSGYQISAVTVDGSSVGAVSSYTFSGVTANHSISATFATCTPSSYIITASAGSGGSISPSGTVSVSSGGSQTFMIAANSGYQISAVTVDGSSVGAVGNYTFYSVTGNHSISATFATCTLDNNKLLWTGGGSAIIWTLDSSDNYVSSIGFGPYSGWTAESYTPGTNGTSKLLWSGTGGYVIIWKLDSSDNYVSSKVYGPYSGWMPISYTFASDGTARLLMSGTGGYASHLDA